jgi:glycosyltransferase involved in cell wall biosynthesis
LPRSEYEAYLVIPDVPTTEQNIVFSHLAQKVFFIYMSWWNRKGELPMLWRFAIGFRSFLETWGHIRPVWSLCKLIQENQIDIVYTDTVLILDGALAAKVCGVPHIWHIKEWIGQQGRVKFWLPDRLLVKFIANLSTYVIVMTNFIGQIFDKYKAGDNVQVIYDGVDLADFQGDLGGRALRKEIGILNDRFVVAMSASLSSTWKRHEVFIKMASILTRQFPNLAFVAFGPEPRKHKNLIYNRPWKYFQDLKEKVGELGLSDRFYWAGFCSNIPQMMDAIDLLVHPCENEPFGRVAIEAMAACRPVVGPNRGGIAESVIHQSTGLLVEPSDPKAFAEGVGFLVQNSQKMREFGLNGRRHVESKFSLNGHVEKITNLYKRSQGKSRIS